MVAKVSAFEKSDWKGRENIAYVRQMIGELRRVAQAEQADMLCYFLEMAYIEAGDVLHSRRDPSQRQGK